MFFATHVVLFAALAVAQPNVAQQLKAANDALRHGRLADAEAAFTAIVKDLGPQASRQPAARAGLAKAQEGLGLIHRTTGDFLAAKTALENAENQYAHLRGLGLRVDLDVAMLLRNQGGVFRDLWRRSDEAGDFVQAETRYKKAISILTGMGGHDEVLSDCYNNLGRMYHDRALTPNCPNPTNDLKEADGQYEKACKLLKELPGGEPGNVNWRLFDTIQNRALLELDQRNIPAAAKWIADAAITQGLDLAPAAAGDDEIPEFRYKGFIARARIRWAQDDEKKAFADLDQAIHIGVVQRGKGAGGPFDRGRYYTQLMSAAERMVEWQTVLAGQAQGEVRRTHVAEAFRAMELTRALALQDQIALRGKLFDGMKPEEARNLEQELRQARDDVAKADIELRFAAQQYARAVREGNLRLQKKCDVLRKQQHERLVQSRRELRDVERQIWNTSPKVAQRMAKDPAIATFADMQKWADQTRALVLEYMVGDADSYVLAIRPNEPALLEKLVWEPTVLKEALDRLCLSPEDVSKTIAEKGIADEELPRRLAKLYEQIVPPAIRQDLAKSPRPFRQVVIVPDGPLVSFPLETLVTALAAEKLSRKSSYLLDLGLPMAYSPSATTLLELANRKRPPQARAKDDVCFVGKSNFTDHSGPWFRTGKKEFGSVEQAVVVAGTRPKPEFGSVDQELPLAAKADGNTLPAILGRAGLKVSILNQDHQTTEPNVSQAIQSARMAVFSTHGLGGNGTDGFFGALLLSRPAAANDLKDDGMLTYEDICECDLHECELVIHTACSTNVGERLRGEGAWAVSRGFLVAGAARVVATQWDVVAVTWATEDASALFLKELAEEFERQINRGASIEALNYAGAVHAAKLAVRKHNLWCESPAFWGPWIMIGAN